MVAAATALLAACGGGSGGSSSGGTVGSNVVTPTPSPSQTTSACSLSARKQFAREVIDQWYLFPDLVNTGANPASYATVQDYINALVAPARAQSKDRYFTYITSIAEENAYYASGSTAGFGMRLALDSSSLVVLEAFEGAPALAAGIDRGSRIVAIGTSAGTMRDVADILASDGSYGISEALGPSDPGVTRYLEVEGLGIVALSKTDFALDPVSDRYGAKIIDAGGVRAGYINLRTFIDTAEPDLRAAFDSFRAQGIDKFIIDLRYNGGGLVAIADVMGDLMGRDNVGQVWSRMTVRPSKAAEFNSTRLFEAQPEAVAPVKVAFIGRGGTASASELVINSMLPYLGTNMALVGANTYGKPVGQFGIDNPACDDRMRVVAFRTENADGNADYFTGLAASVPVTCQANDDYTDPLGDPAEASISAAIDFLAGRSCQAIASGGQSTQSVAARRALLASPRPSTAQREVPGLF
ncbi:S41 family peptidase [Croceicoccus bisphenolivorans]|uniref:S41 family peptidase n=1 Tax=Croceicoccus bisphenolivorans TaxID=1783232 RepID=UPI001FDEC444|nr:S41 family peptidase [Croceicoccus bisphenolivorans]